MIDAHTHMLMGSPKAGQPRLRAEQITEVNLPEFFKRMDALGIEKMVTFVQEMQRVYKSWLGSNELAIDLQKTYPEKVIGIIGAEPMSDQNLFHKERLKNIETAVTQHSIKGVCITPPYGHFRANDRRAYPFYQIAEELDIAIMFHHGGGVGGGGGKAWQAPLKYARPVLLDDIVVDFPDLRIHVEHMAYPWSEELFALMKHASNVYTDVAQLFSRPTILARNLMMAKEYGVIDRVVWGSDYDVYWDSNIDLSKYFEIIERETAWLNIEANKILERCGWPTLTDHEIQGILSENSKRFLRI